MKQIEKLYSFINNPRAYDITKNTRVYKCICDIVCDGMAQTGYSDKSTKYVVTWDVINVLNRIGVSCMPVNVAPRGGACGERVFLTGKVYKDCLRSCKQFVDDFLQNNPKKYLWDAEKAFLASLQK